jgi:hypothetical protein
MTDWMTLATYATMFEAELAKAALDSANIPALIRSHGAAGLFGAGFQGAVPGGVAVLVPAADLDRAWTVVVDRSA